MRKLFALMMSALILMSCAACSEDQPGNSEKIYSDTLGVIMGNILAGVGDLPTLVNTEITAENIQSYLFIDPIEGATGVASEPAISPSAHSVCLLRVPEGTDIAEVASRIEQNADPRKWVCVGAEKVEVLYSGNVICLIMSSEAMTDTIVENFNTKYK